jgi:hypothetical protein
MSVGPGESGVFYRSLQERLLVKEEMEGAVHDSADPQLFQIDPFIP